MTAAKTVHVCRQCQRSFGSAQGLLVHRARTRHSDPPSAVPATNGTPPQRADGFVTTKKGALRGHIKHNHHEHWTPPPQTSTQKKPKPTARVNFCPECGTNLHVVAAALEIAGGPGRAS